MRRASLGFLRLLVVGCVVASSGFFAAKASASQLVSNVATHPEALSARVKVNNRGIAMLTFRSNGRVQHVLARGAINARPPVQDGKQVAFKLDYKGGWGFFRDAKYWKKHFGRNVCGRYTGDDDLDEQGDALDNQGDHLDKRILIYACTMPDGSHWAVQSWQRRLRCYGLKNNAYHRVWELRLSHWNTKLAKLDIKLDWQTWFDRHYDHLWGRFTYLGKPVYGFKSAKSGSPLDDWGRNVYFDTFNSIYGPGWKHENAFLTHDPTGNFCYVVAKHGSRPAGSGEQYRATVVGPGVTPDVTWTGDEPGEYDPVLDAQANAQQKIDLAGDSARWSCDIR